MPRPDRSAKIDFILGRLVANHPRDLVAVAAKALGVSRSAVVARIREMVAEGHIIKEGTTRPVYRPGPNHMHLFPYTREGLAEDQVWRGDIQPLLQGLPQNIIEIAEYGVTEIVNNAIDHSEGSIVFVALQRLPEFIQIAVMDDGVGIFTKIARLKALSDERLALLELSKGKLTTDPSRHSGEGIFFTSRMFDVFHIRSKDLFFAHDVDLDQDWLLDEPDENVTQSKFNTIVRMRISTDSTRLMEQVFAEFSSGPDDYAFAKTIVPVRMAKLGDENLISRSQAKRVLQGVHRFRHIVFDFAGVEKIGQAFADEIFRVFALAHSDIELEHVHATPEVQQMIRRAEVLRDETSLQLSHTKTPTS
jgi:anti-sigma regulatory factor (Ser/Thr protein kinase)